MSEKTARSKTAKGAAKRPQGRVRESAWRAAEYEYALLIAAGMVPLLGGRLSRDEQIGELEAIVRSCPAFYPALFHLGVLRAAAGRSDPARRLLLEGADRMAERESSSPRDVDVTGAVIEPLEESLRYDLARDLLMRLTEHYPSEPSFYDELGGALVVLGEPDEAIRRFEKAVALDPDNARYVCNLGWGFLAAGRLDDAKAHLERSLEMDSEDGITRGNYEVLRFLQRPGGSFEDYLVRPLERKKLGRLQKRAEDTGDYRELDGTVKAWNYDRLEAWKWELCRRQAPPAYPEVYRSLRAFLGFVEQLSQDSYLLYEDLDLLAGRFKLVLHKFIFKMADADAEILEQIYAGLLAFYGFLCRRGLVGERAFAAFRSEALGVKPSLLEKAERYAAVRHDESIPEEEKERIREELFEGDHLWPWI